MSATQRKHGRATPSTDIYELEEVASPDVPEKYRGTDADNLHMKVLGRVQETRRNFTFFTSKYDRAESTRQVPWIVIGDECLLSWRKQYSALVRP